MYMYTHKYMWVYINVRLHIHVSVHLCMQAHKLVDTELRKVMAPAPHLIDNTLQQTATHCNTLQHAGAQTSRHGVAQGHGTGASSH